MAKVKAEVLRRPVVIEPPVFSGSGDLEEQARDETDALVTLALLQHERAREERVAAVREHTLKGMRGICSGCGRKIPKARMNAFSGAVDTCVSCQTDRERSQATEPIESFM